MKTFFAAFLLTILALFGAGCATQSGTASSNRAPIEDRGTMTSQAHSHMQALGPIVAAQGLIRTQAPLGIENAGKPGYYTVKQGDTLIRIGLDNGQNWRDLARWNQLDSPSRIEVGQVLRVAPPVGGAIASPASAVNSGVIVTPVPLPGAMTLPTVLPSVLPSTVVSQPAAAATVVKSADDLTWIWPTTSANLLAGFDEVKNKGLDIGGKLGDSVLASADGRVVYAGAGLRGYGNLIILKHNETFLSAYAHNQTLLVKEEQTVTKGQKIAEMGQSDSDKVKLHFEIRRQGKPVDPAQYLPKR